MTKGFFMAEMGFNVQQSKAKTISVPLDEFKHALFIGRTGNGKTTGGINPVMESRIAAGYGMLVFDEKGKEHRVVKSIAASHGRLEDVIELGKPHGIKINLLGGLSERQIESFIRRLLKRSNESFWTEGAVNMAMALIKWLTAIKKLYAFGVETFDMGPIALELTYTDPRSTTIHNGRVSHEPLSAKELSGYFHNAVAFALVSQKAAEYTEQLIVHLLASIRIKHILQKHLDEQVLIAEALIDELKELESVLKGKIIKADLSESSGNNGVYFMLSAILNVVGSNLYVNETYAADIATLLSQGKIIVINTESFSIPILSTLLDQTLESLSTRSKHKNIHPISVIIDEANRVLSPDSDIRIDVLRESKVEVIMATQNHEQMMIKMGEDRWLSFAQNFNSRYHFMGHGLNGKFKVFDERSDEELSADPMFFEDEKLDQVEWEYQNQSGYYGSYFSNSDHKEIVLYDHALLETEGKLLVYDITTKTTRKVSYIPSMKSVKSDVVRKYLESLKGRTIKMAG
jgi:hypothetical protein